MKIHFQQLMIPTAWVVYLLLACSALATPLRPITRIDPALGSPVGGNGDSRNPIRTPDGRYVAFASVAIITAFRLGAALEKRLMVLCFVIINALLGDFQCYSLG